MKKHLNFLIAVLMILSNHNLQAAPFDTGMIELQQPDETTFTGRIWGDEFFYWAETEDGYRFVQSGDGWYYYATLNQDGEFAPTEYKVGIDEPPISSYQLERTQSRIDEINQQIEEFNEQIENNRQWYSELQEQAQGQEVQLKVGIILIEFNDIKHFDPDIFPRIGGYLTADFDSMMFSYNYWYDITVPTPHPENELLFGSFRDYWDQMSRGKLKITGKVVNPDNDEDGVPDWLVADHTRAYYADSLTNWRVLAYETIAKAIEDSLIDTTNTNSPNYYDKYAIVYAQDAIRSGSLHVHAAQGGKYFFLAERSGFEAYGPNKAFTHIGIYAHEFGHTIGFYDEYIGGGTDIFNFCLMAGGGSNGPDRKAACPATLSPWYRIDKNWVSQPELIDSDKVNFLVEYDNNNPKLYRINPIEAINNEHYIIETKNRDGFDLYIPGNPADTVDQPGRLIVWQHNTNSNYPVPSYKDKIRIKQADNDIAANTQLNDFFPAFLSMNNYQSFNDTTAPAATFNETFPGHEPSGKPAHFALNGIQKLADGNTLIEEIILNHPLKIINDNSGGWQTVSVPFGLTDYSIPAVFPTREPGSSVFKYNGVIYVSVNILENGPGYLAKFPAGPQSLSFQGSLIEYIEIPVHQGWNITGSVSYSIPVSNIYTIPPDIITGTIFQFDGVYVPVNDFIKPGIGYWIKTTSAGVIVLDKNAQPNEMQEIKFDEMDKFTITEADGFSQTLFVANIDIDTVMAGMNLDLPPFFPELNFDSRFEYNEYVKEVSADSGMIDLNILVQTNAYPVSLTWELNPANDIDYSFINDSSTGKISSTLNETGNAIFSQLDNNRIRLFAKANKNAGSTNLPTKFTLYQNYPNPFNPVTTIKYDIVKAQDVKVTVYDILGKEVTTLVNNEQQNGSYEVKWDASNVASGIYFYQLNTKDYIDTKKMILLR